ncbi:hypothetical protein DV736_g6643, partial [Chaetothyriales sp. CBS 134916]
MGNLASTYRNQVRWEAAEELFVQVIETRKKKLGADHPDTLTSMANLASTYRNQGRWEDAEELDVQVMEASKMNLGADHPDTLTSMNNLALTWESQGRHVEASALMESCVKARQRVLGPQHPYTLSSIVTLDQWRTLPMYTEYTDDGSRDVKDTGSSRRASSPLSGEELAEEAREIVKNANVAELKILDLMDRYSFNFLRLKEILRANNLDVSFSKVKYEDIAPKLGLRPSLRGNDIPNFEMSGARLPSSVFSQILADLQLFSFQYGPPSMHINEEARGRFLSGYFNRIVGLFSGLLINTPEAILEGKMTTKGRIEYQFKIFGGVTVVFIEVKMNVGNLTERLNCYAQVMAECDAGAWMNFQDGFNVPIMAVLCDGAYFYFFKFKDKRQAGGAPQFLLVSAEKALKEAQCAWTLQQDGKKDLSKTSAERAVQLLTESVQEAPQFPVGFVAQITEERADEI